ncbi:MAG: ATP-binding protein [Candidatus Methanofastidiosa archaeon]|nr:ATP-binding protein [Candidatus Methanofastidiosa archaeon]
MEKSVTIASKIENLRVIEKVVDEVASSFKIADDIYGNVMVAALEAVNNAIVHGNKMDEKKFVNVKILLVGNELHIIVKDQGKGFDYQHIPDPTAPENIENISGRGVFLMTKLSDKLIFEDNGSKAELVFNLK